MVMLVLYEFRNIISQLHGTIYWINVMSPRGVMSCRRNSNIYMGRRHFSLGGTLCPRRLLEFDHNLTGIYASDYLIVYENILLCMYTTCLQAVLLYSILKMYRFALKYICLGTVPALGTHPASSVQFQCQIPL